MTELHVNMTRRTEETAEVFFTPPFGMTEEQLDTDGSMHWTPSMGDCVYFEIGEDDLRDVAERYNKDLPANGEEELWYNDKECVMYVASRRRRHYPEGVDSFYLIGQLYVPMQGGWELDDEETSQEIW